MNNVGKHWGTMAQQTDNDLSDLPDKINKSRRADSGIDHSGDFTNSKTNSKGDRDIQRTSADSGQESLDQMDTSVNTSTTSTGKKKRGFFKSFKKIFKRKSRHRNNDDNTTPTEQYRTRRSETETVSISQNDEPNEKFRRFNSDASGMSPNKSPHDKEAGDDEEKVSSLIMFCIFISTIDINNEGRKCINDKLKKSKEIS